MSSFEEGKSENSQVVAAAKDSTEDVNLQDLITDGKNPRY